MVVRKIDQKNNGLLKSRVFNLVMHVACRLLSHYPERNHQNWCKANSISQRIISRTFQHCSLLLYTDMEDHSRVALLEMFRKRIEVLNARLETLKKLSAPLEAPPPPRVPPVGLLRLPFEIRLQIYHYCIPREARY
jgi:hypothetical protein